MKTSTWGEEDFADISGILRPKSIAVIGASDRSGNIGGDTVRRLLKFKFPGPVWPVNPRQQTVCGLPCYPSPRELPGTADFAVFAVSADVLLESIAECAAAGTRHGVAYAGGFADAGGEGIARQKALTDLCREHGFKLVGPNCVGVISTELPVTESFSTALHPIDRLVPGGISLVAQSGGMATVAMIKIMQAGFGFRHLISSGNEAVLSLADYLYAMARDEGTRVIAGYMEGTTNGSKLRRALQEARDRRKPVILMKAGTTGASSAAAKAHTGALAGEDRVFEAIFRETAVIRVYSIEEMVDVALLISSTEEKKLPKGPNVGVITFGGGNGVLATDQCAQNGLSTPPLTPEAKARLKPLLLPVATASNPMDLTPTTAFRPESMANLPKALDVVAAEPQNDAMIAIVGSLSSRAPEITEALVGLWERAPKAVAIAWPDPPAGVPQAMAARGTHCFDEQARALRALSRVVKYQADLTRPRHPDTVELPSFDWSAQVPGPGPNTVLPEHLCHRLLAAAGLPVAPGEVVNSEEEAARAAAAVGLPVALKAVSPEVTHRAAVGLLAIDVRTEEEVRAAYRRLADRARELRVKLDGIYVQHMMPGGPELLVSAFRDPLFGPMVTVGAGGNFTEMLDDAVVERAPLDEALALDLLGRLRLVRGLRRKDPTLDLRGAAEFIVHFSRLAATAPWRRFALEVNPIKWTREGAVAVDGLLIIEEP